MSAGASCAALVAVLLCLSHQVHSMSYKDLLFKTIWSSDVSVGDLELKGFKILHRQRDYLPISNVTSLAMHVKNNYLFVADSIGTIRRFNITFINNNHAKGNTAATLSHRTVMKFISSNDAQVNLTSVSQMSVDWLNDMLYIVSGDGKILRCDLDGHRFQTLIEGFDNKTLGPFNLQVDPINGFIFYSLKGDRKGGIYKVGLHEFQSSKSVKSLNSRGKKRNTVEPLPKHFEQYQRLIAQPDISVFTLNYVDGKILYPREVSNSHSAAPSIEMVSVSIDGQHESIIRRDSQIQSSKFGNFKKLTYIEDLFQWINGDQIFIEERTMPSFTMSTSNSTGIIREFVHNSYSLPAQNGPVTSIVCFTDKLQPYPQPRLPVDQVKAVFKPKSARVTWKQPVLLPGQDPSAWQGWEYELSIIRANSNNETEHTQNNLKDTSTMIVDLTPETEYSIKVRAYLGDKKAPWSKEYRGSTPKSDSPSHKGVAHASPPSPAKVMVESEKCFVQWSKPETFGADTVYYQLFLADANAGESDEDPWNLMYNGSNTHWYMMQIAPNRSYKVKVHTITEYGQSVSSESSPFMYMSAAPSTPLPSVKPGPEYIIALSGFMALFLLALIAVFCAVTSNKRKDDTSDLEEHKKGLSELVSLPELPPHSHQTNVLYMPGFSVTDELAMIPHVRAEQIEKTKPLGEGAFGKVYEGYVHRLWGPHSGKTKVAIKTLPNIPRKQASVDFLKEAKLMSNFNHPHILRLMAVCVDNNSFINALILELMEGGDLKRYVASNRPTANCPSKLTMADLMNICIDVAKGCKYLEDMHFIHRDIAARNCLVSSTDRATRTVKIGDFGLARDVYKSDYYRKGTDALVPCRWMSPESLTHGKFTTQCDIWAFGVLMWEVMTLGEQPYSSLGNTAVLNYVRCGGILGKPEACPQDLYTLMKLCWSFDPLKRPTFAMLLQRLEEFASRTDLHSASQITMTSVHNHSYSRNYLLSQKNKLKDNERMKTLSSKTGASADDSSTCPCESSLMNVEISLEKKETTCDTNGYSIASLSSGFESQAVSGNNSPVFCPFFESSSRSQKQILSRHADDGDVGHHEKAQKAATSTESSGDNFATVTHLHLDSRNTNDAHSNDPHYVNRITDGGRVRPEVPSVVSSGIDTLGEEPRQCASQGAVVPINAYINSSVITSDLLRKNCASHSGPFSRSLTLLSKVNETFPRQTTQHRATVHNASIERDDWSAFDSEADSTCTSSSSGTSSHMIASSRESIAIHEYQIPRNSTMFKSAARLKQISAAPRALTSPPSVSMSPLCHIINNNNDSYTENNNYTSIVTDESGHKSSVAMKKAQLILTQASKVTVTKAT